RPRHRSARPRAPRHRRGRVEGRGGRPAAAREGLLRVRRPLRVVPGRRRRGITRNGGWQLTGSPGNPRPPRGSASDIARVVITVQALRALVYGFGAVILGSTLATEGLSAAAVGTLLTAMLAGMAIASLAVGRWADRVGRRRAYRLLLATMGISGTIFAITSWLPLLLLAALTGTLSTD